jgi:CMP-N,N'-diacetyllegionaminic acid synthase
MNNILCTICARSGSQGIKNKNIKLLNGKPLIAYTIKQALESGLFEHVVISTDSEDIASIAQNYGADVFFKRDKVLSTNKAGKLEVIKDAFMKSEIHYATQFDYLVDLDATSPLRSVEDICSAFKKFIDNNNSNLVTAMPSRRNPYFNLIEIAANGKIKLSKNLNDEKILRRQDAPKCYDMNASIYIWRRDTILTKDTLFLEETGLYVMPEERSIDIDTQLDFEFVEYLMRKNAKQ